MYGNHSEYRKKPIPDERLNTNPSKVLHVRELAEHTLEIDVYRALELFGEIKDVVMIPKKRQALVEFHNINSAQDVVRNFRNDHVNIGGKPAKVNYSTSDTIKKMVSDSESVPTENKVLIFFIYDAVYPINVEVLLRICRPHGRVARIFINRKSSSLHALVEFFTIEEAIIAKRNLNGADIYSGCCTIKIEFATTDRVHVVGNTDDSYDFQLTVENDTHSLLGVPAERVNNYGMSGHRSQVVPRNYAFDRSYEAEFRRHDPSMMVPLQGVSMGSHGNYSAYDREPINPSYSNGPRIVMFYNLDYEIINCDRLFNLACLYGNVEKIKFLKSKEGTAMVQMSDPMGANNLLKFVHNITAFHKKIQLQYSKQPVINEVKIPFELNDGTPSYKEYIASKDNRFTNAEFAHKNRITYPTRTLNYWNAPPKLNFEQLLEELTKYSSSVPSEHHQLTDREKSSSGLIQFENTELATECVILCNHIMIDKTDAKFPYQLKLGFSENPIRVKGEGNIHKRNSEFSDAASNDKRRKF